jgi:hypothetical protein
MAVGNQKTQKIYKENYQFLKTSVYNDPKFLLFTPNVANADLTISLALVYDSFSFFFLRINVFDFFRNEIDLNKNMSESKSIPAREM